MSESARFDDDFLAQARSDPYGTVLRIAGMMDNMLESSGSDWQPHEVGFLLEAFALISEMMNAGLLEVEDVRIELNGDLQVVGPQIAQFIDSLQKKYAGKAQLNNLNRMRARFALGLGSGVTYEFTSGDLDRVQRLITETREAIRACDAFDEKHRRRLLMRLEKLQAEVHKKMSDVDMFWGLMGDAGVALGKFGNDVKPVVDRIKELFSIAWQAQSRAEELPSNDPPPRIEYKRDENKV